MCFNGVVEGVIKVQGVATEGVIKVQGVATEGALTGWVCFNG